MRHFATATGLMLCAAVARVWAGAEGAYVLGPDDQIAIRVSDAEDLGDKPFAIGSSGVLTLPLVGAVQAGGLTVEQLQASLNERFARYIRNPRSTVTVTEFRSQPVTVLGSVQNPGQQQLKGSRTLLEVLAAAGGVRPDAGNSVRITRRAEMGAVPVETVRLDAAAGAYVAEIRLKTLVDAVNPEQNIAIKPRDIISVPKGDVVYVVGTVRKSGGFVVGEKAHLTVLEALSMAEGLERFADARKAKILRTETGQTRRSEIAVDLEKLLSGRGEDIALRPDDVLFVPANKARSAAMRTLETALGVGGNITTGLVVYRR